MNDVPLDTVKWDGEGLPPVGAKCEAKHKRDETWLRHVVLGVGHSYIFSRLLPGQTEDGEQVGGEGLLHIDNYDFRPIRTPEEVEREELEAVIMRWHNCTVDTMADAILTAGYRKQEVKK